MCIRDSLSIASSARKVTALGAGLFKNNTTITSVSIPSSVNTIGASAFEGCSRLSEVNNSSALKKIGANAFKNCKKLKNIELPETVTSIGAAAFMNCSAPVSYTHLLHMFLHQMTDRYMRILRYISVFMKVKITVEMPSAWSVSHPGRQSWLRQMLQ